MRVHHVRWFRPDYIIIRIILYGKISVKLEKHCKRSGYAHCRGKTEAEIVKKITDYIKYHKTSYAVYDSYRYKENGKWIDIPIELLKYIGLGNYLSIGKVEQWLMVMRDSMFSVFCISPAPSVRRLCEMPKSWNLR